MAGQTIQLLGAERLSRRLSLLERHVFPMANSRALNRSLTKMRTVTVRQVSKVMGVPQKSVRSRTVLTNATPAHQVATARFKGRAFNLSGFRARQTKKGLSAAPWGNRRIFPHGFLVIINGARVAMTRQKRAGVRVGRMPIRAMLGPGIAKTAAEDEIKKARTLVLTTVYPVELERQLRLLVRQEVAR